MSPSSLLSGAVALASALAMLPATAATYRIVDLGAAASGENINRKGEVAGQAPDGRAGLYARGLWKSFSDRGHGSVAWAIDDAGNMAGDVYADRHVGHSYATYYPRGKRRITIPLPGGKLYSSAQGLSPDGTTVVGTFDDAHDVPHCFAWRPGDAVATDIGLPPGGDYEWCSASGVNDAGEIVGTVQAPGSASVPFIYKDGRFSTSFPGGSGRGFSDVNKNGHAVGSNDDFGASFWNGKKLVNIPPMRYATGLNDHDDIIGYDVDSQTGRNTLLLYSGGTLIDIVPLIVDADGWSFFTAVGTGINDRGEISGKSGWHKDDDGIARAHAFKLVPNE